MNAQEFITIPKGTVIKIKGIPFELKEDTKVLGLESNYKLALSQSEHCLSKPVHVESRQCHQVP